MLYEGDRATVSTMSQMRFYPLAIVRGNGCDREVEDGGRVLDLTAGLGAAGLGYSHAAVVKPVDRTMRAMPGVSILSNAPAAVELAERLLELYLGDGETRGGRHV